MNTSDPQPTPPTAPAAARAPGFQARKGQRGYRPMTFLGSLRGDGRLLSSAGEAVVAYQLDVYEGGGGRTGSGTLDGDARSLEEDGPLRLRLESGAEIGVSLNDVDEAGAVFDTRGAVPAVQP